MFTFFFLSLEIVQMLCLLPTFTRSSSGKICWVGGVPEQFAARGPSLRLHCMRAAMRSLLALVSGHSLCRSTTDET